MKINEKTGSVLVVEAEASAREELGRTLRAEYHVYEAADGEAAVDLLRTRPIDTVTVDPYVPGIRGRELLRRMKEARPDVRVIIVTRHRLSLWFDDMIREEVFDYLPKPFEARDLLRAVQRSMVRPRRPVAVRLAAVSLVAG